MSKLNLKPALISATVITANLLTPVAALAAVPDYSSNVASLVSYLEANQAADGSITGFGGETSWAIMGLAANGIDPETVENGGNSVLDFLAANPPADTAVTAWERDLLAITAAGENPFTFGGRNYVSKVQAFANNDQLGSTTGVNDDIFGVLALISAGPSADQTIISKSIDFIIAHQNVDGGWSFSTSGTSDTNDSATAVQALKAAEAKGFTNSGLGTAITNGVNYLTGLQQPDGGWEYQAGFGTDAGSTAWVILALLGDDSAVTEGLNFIVGKQAVSGGIDGGFGVDTYTSSNSLIAFGQISFPVDDFEGTFTEPEPEPNPQPNPDPNQNSNNNQNNTSNPPGQVLVATKTPGQVLAETLPNTGIIPSLGDLVPEDVYQPSEIKVNKLLLFGLVLIESGLIAHLVAGRVRKNGVN